MQLAEVRELSEIRFAIPLRRRWVLCTGVCRADDRISVREQDIDIGKQVWHRLRHRGLLGPKVSMRIGAQLTAQVLAPRYEEVWKLIAGQSMGCFEELVTKPTFRKPVSYPGTTARETGLMVVATREQTDEDKPTSSQLDGRVCNDVGRGVHYRVVAIHATICVLRGMLAVA